MTAEPKDAEDEVEDLIDELRTGGVGGFDRLRRFIEAIRLIKRMPKGTNKVSLEKELRKAIQKAVSLDLGKRSGPSMVDDHMQVALMYNSHKKEARDLHHRLQQFSNARKVPPKGLDPGFERSVWMEIRKLCQQGYYHLSGGLQPRHLGCLIVAGRYVPKLRFDDPRRRSSERNLVTYAESFYEHVKEGRRLLRPKQ